MPKITLIGAGSVVFAKTLVCDLLQFPEFADCTVCVMDLNPARLRVAEVMVRKVVAKLRLQAKVQATLDRREAIKGAHYVICTIQVGGYKPGTVIDFEIPRKYGLLQTIGDTLGIGGIFRGLRTIPAVVDIARDIADVGAPGCLFLNYTNPMAMLCMAVDQAVGVPTVGLCHSVQGTSQMLARQCGFSPEDVTYKVAGINHMAFFLEFRHRGRDAYPLLFRKLRENSYLWEKVRFEMMRRLGYFVTESSEHQSEYNPHFIHFGPKMVKEFDIPIDEYLRRCEAILASWQEQERKLIGEDGEIEVPPQGHEYGSYIIHSRETNTPRVIYGNVPNTGLITNLPHRCCVEVPVLVDAQGLQPTFIGELPLQLAAICRSNINVQELTVRAALTRSRESIYHAAMSDPHTAATLPLDRIWALCDELIEAHQKVGLLGEFKDVIPSTGRALAGTGDGVIAQVLPVGESDETASGKRLDLVLDIDNASGVNLAEDVALRLGNCLGAKAPASIRVRLKAGERKQFPFSLQLPPATAACLVEPLLGNAGCLSIPYDYRTRKVISVSEGPASLEIQAHGQVLMSASLSVEKGQLRVEGRMADTDVKVDREEPWQASVIEIFLASVDSSSRSQFFFLPDARKPRVVRHACGEKPLSGSRATCRIDRNGYRFAFNFPLPPELNAARSFLLHLIARAGAVGEAHGPARVALGEVVDGHQSTAHYRLVKRS